MVVVHIVVFVVLGVVVVIVVIAVVVVVIVRGRGCDKTKILELDFFHLHEGECNKMMRFGGNHNSIA